MFGSDCGGCYSARDYEQAKDRWHKTPASRGAKWGADERPLDNVRKHHYRIVQGEGEAHYDIVLHDTVMARFHKPTTEGWRVQYNYYKSSTSHNFMWRVLGISGRDGYGVLSLRTTDGRDVMVPIGRGSHVHKTFGASLWFTAPDVIDVSRSDHALVEIPKYTDEFKAWRAELHSTFKPLTDLFAFCAEEVRQKWEPPQLRYRHPGSLRGISTTDPDLWALQRYLNEARSFCYQDLLEKQGFIDLARAAYKTHVTRSLDVRDYRALETPTTDVLAKAAARALLKQMLPLWGARSSLRWEPLPKFVEHLPKNFRRT
jgi:hypothetical protein